MNIDLKRKDQKSEWYIMTFFHKNNLLRIKEALGKKCTYVAHERYKDKYSVVAKFGKEEPIVAMLEGTPDDIEPKYYIQLKNDLENEARNRKLI